MIDICTSPLSRAFTISPAGLGSPIALHTGISRLPAEYGLLGSKVLCAGATQHVKCVPAEIFEDCGA